MELLNTITFVIGLFAVLGLVAWGAVMSQSAAVERNRRSSRLRAVAAQPVQRSERDLVGSRS
jgi:hypothetical protein